MVQSLTEGRIQEIRNRCDAATPGPWRSFWEGRHHTSGDSVIIRGEQEEREDLYISPCTMADQDFIAHARQDVPALLDEVLRLRGLLKEAGLEIE